MTNEQMAMRIAKVILENDLKTSALEGVLATMQNPDGTPLDWQKRLRKFHPDPIALQDTQLRLGELQTSIADARPEEMIAILYRGLFED